MASLLYFIVSPAARAQYAYLKEVFEGSDTVDVILDRRLAERRRGKAPTEVDRRRTDRRTRDVARALTKYGCILVRR